MALRPDSRSRPPLVGLCNHTQAHHTRKDSSGQVISPTQRPPPDNTQHSKETYVYAPAGFKPAIPASERPQTHVLDHAATGIGVHTYSPYFSRSHLFSIYPYLPLSISSAVVLRPSFCMCYTRATCSAHPNRPDFMALVIYYKE